MRTGRLWGWGSEDGRVVGMGFRDGTIVRWERFGHFFI